MKKVLLLLISLFAGLGLQAKVNEALNGIRRYSREKNREASIRRQLKKDKRTREKNLKNGNSKGYNTKEKFIKILLYNKKKFPTYAEKKYKNCRIECDTLFINSQGIYSLDGQEYWSCDDYLKNNYSKLDGDMVLIEFKGSVPLKDVSPSVAAELRKCIKEKN